MSTALAPQPIRNGGLASIVGALKDQRARTVDVVVGARSLTMQDDGTLNVPVPEQEPTITEDGVTVGRPAFIARGTVGPIAGRDLSGRYGIHRNYWTKMATPDHSPLLATNLNYWTQRDDSGVLVRMFADDSGDAYVRAVLSDRFGIQYDSLDAIAAALDGMAQAGVNPTEIVASGDLTEALVRLRVMVPGVAIAVPDLVEGYRNPRHDVNPTDRKVGDLMAAGIEIGNSDVGEGAFYVRPRLVFLICTNGMVRKQDGDRRVHLGSRMESGLISWATDTRRAALDLMVKQTRDAVSTFMTPGYLEGVAAEMRAAKSVTVTAPTDIIPKVIKAVKLPEDRTDAILNMFLLGGDATALGVGQAITAAAQDEKDADVAAAMETSFFAAIRVAAKA